MSRDMSALEPTFRALLEKTLTACESAGLPVLITETVRTKAEQDKLYAQGRSTPGQTVTNVSYQYSIHCWGMAADFCRNERGREYEDSDGFFSRVGAIARAHGLTWGGRWTSFVDKPHLQLDVFGTATDLKKKYGTPEKFFTTWKEADDMPTRYKTINDLPAEIASYAAEDLLEMMALGFLTGKDANRDPRKITIDMTENMIRTEIINFRMYKDLLARI